MQALRFHASIPRYLTTKALSKISSLAYYNFFSPTKLDTIPEPKTIPGWVKVSPILTGICGSDINTILLRESPLLEPLCSFPSVLGHESVGLVSEVNEEVAHLEEGDRVVLDPILSCRVRGIVPVCQNCKNGDFVRCNNFDRGNIRPGFDTGWCNSTGGAFSSAYLAHHTQLHKVPKYVTDDNAVLVEPFTIGLHAVMRHFPNNSDTVLVIGTGVIGLMVLLALRALGSKAKIIALDTNEVRGKMAVEKCGATEYTKVEKDYFSVLSKRLRLREYHPILEKKPLLVGGGADLVFECVGLPNTIEDALRLTKAGGKFVLIGNPHKIPIDWSLVWARELNIMGSFGSCMETFNSKSEHAFDTALHMLSNNNLDLSWMITHRFRFPNEYKKAIRYSMNKDKYNMVKAVFTFNDN
ncbi:MAG: alcohol dehydrogenase [Candidatus Heimdallarchaeota archaeon]|nr:alcohol dehydrogenase [Candidatus Heimdallarchaeota archaeon]